MSIIFGIFDKTAQGIDQAWIEAMKKDLSHGNPDRTGIWKNHVAAMGNLSVFNTPESLHEILPFRDNESGMVIVSDSRIDNRSSLAAMLTIGGQDLMSMPDSLLILKAFQKYGAECTRFLKGDFSFAIYDESKRRLFLARDHFGMKPLFYFDHPQFLFFSSELRGILALPFFEQKLNEEWLLDFLINATRKAYDTFYEGIYTIPPGHQMVVENGKASLQKYWELVIPDRIILKNDKEYIEGYKELFDNSVKNRVRSAFPVGAELSGGLDSASIAALAQKSLVSDQKQLHVFSRVLPEKKDPKLDDPDDETKEIKMVCDFCSISNIHWVTMDDQKITENIRHITETIRTPYRSNYAAYNLNAHQYTKTSGVRTLLSGHGGDQMVSNHASFVYKNYLRQHRYFKLFSDIRAKGTIHEIDMLKSLETFFHLRSRKYDFSNKQNETKKLFRYGLDKSYIAKYELKERYLTNRKTETLTPDSLSDLILKISHRHMNDRVEVMNFMAGHENIEYRYPLFDVDLINFYLAIPDEMKHKFRCGRYIHRMAMQGELPPAIQWRTDKHGTINPGLARIFSNDADTIKSAFAEHISKNLNSERTLFDQKILEKLIAVGNEYMLDYKSVINKFFQIKDFIKIIGK